MHLVEQVLQLGSYVGLWRLASRCGGRDFGQRDEVVALVGGELQRVCRGVEHGARDSTGATLFEPYDVVDAHVGELCKLLTAQARHPTQTAVVAQSRLAGLQGGAACAEEPA